MVIGAALGFFVCIFLNYLLLRHVKSVPSNLLMNNLIFFFGLLGAILAFEFKDYMVIIATSFIGSYILVRSISIPIGGFPNEL